MTKTSFAPQDFVYVDPDLRKAVGLVEWDKDGNPLPKEWPYPEKKVEEGQKPTRFKKPRKRYYPWGSYSTMCKLYKLEGKMKDKDTDDYITLEKAIGNLQEDPFWD